MSDGFLHKFFLNNGYKQLHKWGYSSKGALSCRKVFDRSAQCRAKHVIFYLPAGS